MASSHSKHNLQIRSDILNTHKLFINFLTCDIIHVLFHLFNEQCCKERDNHITIAKLIKAERETIELKDDVSISSSAYKDKVRSGSSNLILDIHKRGKKFVHLTIHLSPNSLNPEHAGILHFLKDIYTVKHSSRKSDHYYALIKVEQPNPTSLSFSIGYGYDTPNAKNFTTYDDELQQEMGVIITVLNRLFDSNNKYFVGNHMNYLFDIVNNTNLLLENMNQYTQIATRKNKGKMISPIWANNQFFNLSNVVNNSILSRARKVNRRATRRKTRKVRNNNYGNCASFDS
jgi:hypothetical protein